MILPKRGRWRPKSIDILLSEKETAAWELFTAMESYEYKYNDIIKEISKNIHSQKLSSVWCNATEIANFRRKHKKLKELAKKYFGYLSFDELPWETAEKGVNQHIANLYEMDLENDDSGENRQTIENLAYKPKF